jgi:hypothetical protein
MALMGRHFEEAHKKPQRCGQEARSCLKKKSMKDIANACKTSMD